MSVSAVRLNAQVDQRLGRDAVHEMCRHLYAVDCQGCGDPLGTDTPTLGIDDYGTFVQGLLYHGECRAPDWRPVTLAAGDDWSPATLTYRLHQLLPEEPVFAGSGPWTTIMLVNPGMEAVTLSRFGDRWKVDTVQRYCTYGLRPSSGVDRLPVPPNGAVYMGSEGVDGLRGSLAMIDPLLRWASDVPRYIADSIRIHRGIVLMVTSALDPYTTDTSDFGPTELKTLIRSGYCAAGWLPLIS